MSLLSPEQIQQFKGKRILITGASGFIGTHLTQQLLAAGAIIYATSRIRRVSNFENLSWQEGSFENYETCKRVVRETRPHIIFHLAGEVTAANRLDYVLPTFNSLLTSTVNLLTVATEEGCQKIILTGSSTEPLDDQPYPNSPYAAAKWATTAYGHLFKSLYKTPVTVVRPFMGYGPVQNSGKLIPQVISALLRGESPKLSNGLWITDWVYIDDTIKGFLAAALADNLGSKPIDLGTGVLTSVREIVENLVEIIKPKGKPLFGALPDRHEEHTRIADTQYAAQTLGWKAETTLSIGLQKTVDYYKKVSL